MSESNTHQFNHDNHLSFAIAPPEIIVSGGSPAPEAPETKKKMSLKTKLLIGGAGVALTAIAATGIGLSAANSGAKAPEATSSSAPADPTEEPTTTPSPEATPVPETQVGPDISKYEAMSVAEFSALSNDEQMIYATGKLIPSINQYAADYYSVTNKSSDVLPEGSIDNTAQEIDTQVSYNLRFAMSLTGDEREKFIIAVLRNNNQSGFYPIEEDISRKIDSGVTFSGKPMAAIDIIQTGSAVSISALQEDTNRDKFVAVNGTTSTYNAYFSETTLPDGSTYKTWIRE